MNNKTQGKLVSVDDLFNLYNGLSSDKVKRTKIKANDDFLPYIRPSHKQNTSIDAFVLRKDIQNKHIYPNESLYVSTDGQGSHSYSYVAPFDFVPNSNVSVLIPKRPMNLLEKLYYSICITKNRFKFSYGRKPKGDRLKNLLIPDNCPLWINEFDYKTYTNELLSKFVLSSEPVSTSAVLKLVCLESLFDFRNGISSSDLHLKSNKYDYSYVPFLRPSHKQNSSYVSYVSTNSVNNSMIFPSNSLYVSTNGQGSHTYSYVAPFSFVPNSDVTVLVPKRPMGVLEKLFYAYCITSNRYKFSYGRKPKGERLKKLLVPEFCPDWISNDIINSIIEDWKAATIK